eukprot:gene20384-26454_t
MSRKFDLIPNGFNSPPLAALQKIIHSIPLCLRRGFGTIGRSVLPLLLKHIDIRPDQIEIISANDDNRAYAEKNNVRLECFELNPSNFYEYLSPRLSAGDLLLNLSSGISSLDIIRLCNKLGVLYLDTSDEMWINDDPLNTFARRQRIISHKNEFINGPTALICHGINPGLITHFAKQAVLDMVNADSSQHITYSDSEWGILAKENNIRAIHLTERDTQISKFPRRFDEYINTWSVEVFLDESSENASFVLGSHEEKIPSSFIEKYIITNKINMIELNRKGSLIKVSSWIPSIGNYHGFLIPHPEVFSIAELFSCKQKEKDSFYCPTVKFVFQPCNDGLLSVHDALVVNNKYYKKRLLFDDIIEGMEEVGVLILREDTSSVCWYGSRLDINKARELSPDNNASSLQVAAGVLSGAIWIYENPKLGLIEPEQANFKRILEIASPYLNIENYNSHWTNNQSDDFIANTFKWQFSELAVNLMPSPQKISKYIM